MRRLACRRCRARRSRRWPRHRRRRRARCTDPGGNPFFVTEVLASPARRRPRPVARRCSPASAGSARTAVTTLEQVAVVPSRDPLRARRPAAGRPRIDALAEAELAGMLEVSTHHLGFPPRVGAAGDRAQPAGARAAAPERRTSWRRSSSGGAARAGEPDGTSPSRRATSTRCSRSDPRAAREAARAGSHRQALAHLESVRPHLSRLDEARAGGGAGRLRLGALQRPSLPRGGRRPAGGRRPSSTTGWATRSPSPAASCACRATCSWRARRSRPRECANRGRHDPRADGRRASRAPRASLRERRDPRADR